MFPDPRTDVPGRDPWSSNMAQPQTTRTTAAGVGLIGTRPRNAAAGEERRRAGPLGTLRDGVLRFRFPRAIPHPGPPVPAPPQQR